MKRVLVTGATGFIGRHALAPLVARGYEVHAVGRHAGEATEVQWHRADLLEPGAPATVLARVRPTHLLHFAWYAEHGTFWTAPENRAWTGTTAELFQAFAASGGQRFVGVGSCAEYDWSSGVCVEGQTPLIPATLYGQCKNECRAALERAARVKSVSFAWGRVFHLFGPAEHPGRLVASVMRSLKQGAPARCTAGEQLRDFLHAADVAGAFVALLDSRVEGAVNIASGRPVRLKDVVTKIGELSGQPELIQLGALPMRSGDPPVLAADTARLNREVGWRPRFDLAAGLADTWRSLN